MKQQTYTYIYDAMRVALELIDDNIESYECVKERTKLVKAMEKLYNYYNKKD